MFSGHPMIFAHPYTAYVADLFFIASGALFLFKFFTRKPHKKYKKKTMIQIVTCCIASVIIVVGAILGNHWMNRPKINASPSEIHLRSHSNKPFRLKLTNNEDSAVFDVNFSICVDNKILNPCSIQLIPVKNEDNPNIPFPMLRVLYSNGCCGVIIQDISPHSTREFDTTIIGENVDGDSKVSFSIYQWSRESSVYIFSSTGIKNLEELFKPLKPGEKRDLSENLNLKVPLNPYFQKEKETKYLLYDFHIYLPNKQ